MNKIRECREKLGFNQKYVALALGVRAPSVSNWESGKTFPSSENLQKLAALFGVSIEYLLGQNSESYAVQDKQDQKISLISEEKSASIKPLKK